MPQSFMPSSPRSRNLGMSPKLHKSLGLGSATPARLSPMKLSAPAFAYSTGSVEAPTPSDLATLIWVQSSGGPRGCSCAHATLRVGRGQAESLVCQVARSTLGILAGQAEGLTA